MMRILCCRDAHDDGGERAARRARVAAAKGRGKSVFEVAMFSDRGGLPPRPKCARLEFPNFCAARSAGSLLYFKSAS